jgi:hypothetical protein
MATAHNATAALVRKLRSLADCLAAWPVNQMGDRAFMIAGTEEEPRVWRQQKGRAAQAVELLVHGAFRMSG